MLLVWLGFGMKSEVLLTVANRTIERFQRGNGNKMATCTIAQSYTLRLLPALAGQDSGEGSESCFCKVSEPNAT
jgi:hypothetical protein